MDRNLCLECIATEEGGPNESLTKEIPGRNKSNNVLKNDRGLTGAKTLRLQLIKLINSLPNIYYQQEGYVKRNK